MTQRFWSYEDWRINYQSDEQAARAAWEEMRNLSIRMQELRPLTEEQIYEAIKGIDSLRAIEVARAVEAAHGIK